jgi:hypothetical protein
LVADLEIGMAVEEGGAGDMGGVLGAGGIRPGCNDMALPQGDRRTDVIPRTASTYGLQVNSPAVSRVRESPG